MSNYVTSKIQPGDSLEVNIYDQKVKGFVSSHLMVSSKSGSKKFDIIGYFLISKNNEIIYFGHFDIVYTSRIVLVEKIIISYKLDQDKAFESYHIFRSKQSMVKSRRSGMTANFTQSLLLGLSKGNVTVITGKSNID